MSVLVLDIGTTTLRASMIKESGHVLDSSASQFPPTRPGAGLAEFDPAALLDAIVEMANELLANHGSVSSVGISTQRASTVLFDRTNGEVLGPGLSWQDQRTVSQCVALRQRGFHLAPNQSATKLAYLLDRAGRPMDRALGFATIDAWLAWNLTGGESFTTDATNAAVTGLVISDGTSWDPVICDALSIDDMLLPTIVDSSGRLADAVLLRGRPVLGGLVGDQQASLIGQGCLEPRSAKVTFGTGAMLDVCTGSAPPETFPRGPAGTFPIVTRRLVGRNSYGIEGILLAAGSCVDWLRDGLGIISSAAETSELAGSVRDSGGVFFVPAFGGLGTPVWDFGARGALTGLDSATTRAEVVRAVLEGIAQAGADLLDAAESDGGFPITELRVDGGMAANELFLQLLANATGRVVHRSSVKEATGRGAAFLAGVADGTWASLEECAALVAADLVIEPNGRLDRERWLEQRDRARRTVPFLSALEF